MPPPDAKNSAKLKNKHCLQGGQKVPQKEKQAFSRDRKHMPHAFFCGCKKPPVSGIPDLRTPNSMVLAIFTALSAFHLVCFNWHPPNYSLLVSYLDHPSTMNFFRIYQTCIYSFGTIVSFDQFFYLAVFCCMFLT